MLGPTKWRLLTIVAGILLAHAIESPTSKGNKLNAQVRSFTNPELGLRIEQISPWSTGRNIPARNLLVPHQLFSRVDNIRYIDSRTPNSRHLQSTFGAFRIADQQQTPSSDGLQRRRSKAFQMRRSDEAGVDAGLPLEQQPGASVLPSPEQEPIYQNVSRSQRQHRYKIIPISYFYREEAQPVLPANLKPVGPSRPPKETENDEPEVPDTSSKQAQEQEHAQGGDEYARSDTPVIGARRSGIQFPGPLKAANGFTPQGYSEESLTLGDNLGIFQQPVSTADDYGPVDGEAGHEGRGTEEFSRSLYANRYFRDFSRPPIDLRPAESLPRPSRLIEFPGSVNVKQPFRDDVTKFGDVAGPVTAVQRPFGEFGGDGQKNFRAFDPTYYTDSPYQPNRPAYFPAKLYTEPNQKIYQPLWKTRSPRVVFPQAQDLASGPSGFGVDNVVFRDQNFGLNELAAIQDVRNEFNQDDINDEPATTSKDRVLQAKMYIWDFSVGHHISSNQIL
uniref:Uncharacterized protein n=1 Tax=Anopheles quadriannulatus TaxID=34691 RepID=A0A182WXP5_ANOQN